MKKIIYILLTVLTITSATAQHTSKWKIAGGANTGYFQGGNGSWNPGDTIVFQAGGAPRTYFTLQNVHGTAANHLTFWNNGGVAVLLNGFSFTNCSYIDIKGWGSSNAYGFKISDNINSGVGITITGLSRCITTDRVEITNKLYGYWIKNESYQTGCDSTQWYPHYEDSIIVEHNYGHRVNQEFIYGGSTDPGGVAVERAVTCFGIKFTPRSSALKDIFIRYNIINGTGRTPIQLSALSFGKYEVIGNTITNGGYEVSLTQWPCIWIGGEGQAEGIIAYNVMDSSSRNNITCYGNNVYIHDNKGRNAGIARDVNTGTVYRFSYYSNLSIEIKPTHPYTKTTFKVANNDFLPTGTNVSVYVAGAAKDFTDTGNYICNSGTKLFTDNKVKYLDGCPVGGGGSDTTYETIKVQCDSMQTVTYDTTVYYDSVGSVILKTVIDTVHFNTGSRYHGRTKHVTGAWTYHLSKDSSITRTVTCSKCALCDSVIMHVSSSLLLGIMPFGTANTYGVDSTRDAVMLKYWYSQPITKARIRAYNAKDVTINLSERNSDGSPAHFYTDTVAYKAMLRNVADSFTNIKRWVVGNEEGHSAVVGAASPYYLDSIQYYFPELKAALNELTPRGLDVTNGGLIFVRFWYYNKTHDSAFFQDCFNSTQRSAYNNGSLNYKIFSTDQEINFFKTLPKLRKINIHQLYVSSTAELAGLKRMCDYLKLYTGKKLTSNEVGYYVDDVDILTGLKDLAITEGFEELIYYSGDSGVTGPALEIPADEFAEVR